MDSIVAKRTLTSAGQKHQEESQRKPASASRRIYLNCLTEGQFSLR
jgi:hypothetical protein